jgi:Protein of unknown function (DUF3649)
VRFVNESTRYWSVVSRVAAAGLGGYALTSLSTIALSLLLAELGVGRAEAVVASIIASFPYYAVIIMAVFCARSATRAWMGLIIASVPPGLVAIFLRGR